MYILRNDVTDPAFNLALEQYLLENRRGEYFWFWRNERSVVVGKNQNTQSEIDQEFVEKHGICVVRRLSGGGAVFHDLGNINYSYVTDHIPGDFIDFAKYTRPIIEVLSTLGVRAELSGRNDILVNGSKISGNAQYVRGERLLHHGTLLFDADINYMQNALHADGDKFIDKAVRSVRGRVVNLKQFLPEGMDATEFMRLMERGIMERYSDGKRIELTPAELSAINELADKTYRSWDWNYGYSPNYSFRRSQRLKGGSIEVRMDVANGVIGDIRFFGDFFGEKDVSELCMALRGVKHERSSILYALADVNVGAHIHGATNEDVIGLLF